MDLEANYQGPEGEIKNNHENGKEYVKITQIPYQNMMLDKQVLRTKKIHVGHIVSTTIGGIWHEIWTCGLQKRHSYI